MFAWRVVLDERLLGDLDSITEMLAQRLELAPLGGRAAVEAALKIGAFEAFVEALNNLRKGHTDPTRVLKYRGLPGRNYAICVLTLGDWQASFWVDKASKSCTGIFADEVTPWEPF